MLVLMKHWFFCPWPSAGGGPDAELAEGEGPLPVASRACCCAASPLVRVVMPPTPDRPRPVDLLLCGHHYRASHAALQEAGAAAYNKDGALILAAARELPSARELETGPLARLARLSPGGRPPGTPRPRLDGARAPGGLRVDRAGCPGGATPRNPPAAP